MNSDFISIKHLFFFSKCKGVQISFFSKAFEDVGYFNFDTSYLLGDPYKVDDWRTDSIKYRKMHWLKKIMP